MGAPRTELIRARERLNLTRPEFAKRAGISRHYVFYVETGRRNPSFLVINRWLEALGRHGKFDLFNTRPQPAADQKPAA